MTVSIHMISVILQTRLCDLCYLKPDLNLPNLLCSDLKKKKVILYGDYSIGGHQDHLVGRSTRNTLKKKSK